MARRKLSEAVIMRLSQADLLKHLEAWDIDYDPKQSLLRLRLCLFEGMHPEA